MRILIEDEDYEPLIDIEIEREMNTNSYHWTASKPNEWKCYDGSIYNHEADVIDLVQKVLTSIGKI